MLREQIEIVAQGGEPMALVRDPARNAIIELPAWVAEIDVERVEALVGAACFAIPFRSSATGNRSPGD